MVILKATLPRKGLVRLQAIGSSPDKGAKADVRTSGKQDQCHEAVLAGTVANSGYIPADGQKSTNTAQYSYRAPFDQSCSQVSWKNRIRLCLLVRPWDKFFDWGADRSSPRSRGPARVLTSKVILRLFWVHQNPGLRTPWFSGGGGPSVPRGLPLGQP